MTLGINDAWFGAKPSIIDAWSLLLVRYQYTLVIICRILISYIKYNVTLKEFTASHASSIELSWIYAMLLD